MVQRPDSHYLCTQINRCMNLTHLGMRVKSHCRAGSINKSEFSIVRKPPCATIDLSVAVQDNIVKMRPESTHRPAVNHTGLTHRPSINSHSRTTFYWKHKQRVDFHWNTWTRGIIDFGLRWALGPSGCVPSRDEYPFDEHDEGIHVFPCAILAETSTNCAGGLAMENASAVPANMTGRIVFQHICARQWDLGLASARIAETTSSKLDGRTVEAGKP